MNSKKVRKIEEVLTFLNEYKDKNPSLSISNSNGSGKVSITVSANSFNFEKGLDVESLNIRHFIKKIEELTKLFSSNELKKEFTIKYDNISNEIIFT